MKTLILKKNTVAQYGSFRQKKYKYFIEYKDDDHKSKPLRIMLPKTSAYVKCYDAGTKWILFLLKIMSYQKYKTVFGIESTIALPIYNEKCLKTKISSYGHDYGVWIFTIME